MTTSELLTHLRKLNVTLSADNGQLIFNGPKGALTATLRAELTERKTEILKFLHNAAATRAAPTESSLRCVSRDKDLPLSFAQQRLWFLDQLEPGSTVYNVPGALRIKGPLDVGVLKRSLEEMVRRHEALRTTFSLVEGEPVQVIAPSLSFSLPVLDISHFSEGEREEEAQRLATEETKKPFDLGHGPLFRPTVIRLREDDHVLLLTLHHIVSDGWSMGVLYRELSVLYQAFANSEPSPLAVLPIQYADFAAWQREWLQGEVLETQLSYWKKQLEGAPVVLNLPTDRPRPTIQSFRGASQSVELSTELTQGLKTFSRKEGVTLYMTLLATFQTLLHRYTGQDDIVVGSPIANRNRIEIEGLIGFFVNTLVLRTDHSGNPTFCELLHRVREMALEAYAHQDLPFEKLVEELRPDRDPSRSPLFQAMFVFQNATARELSFKGLNVSPVRVAGETAKFDLTLSVNEATPTLRAVLLYNIDLFDEATIMRMLGHFQVLLKGIIANPDLRISQLPILTETEKHQLLIEWNVTKKDYPRDKCIHALFEAQVEKTPDAIAVVFEDLSLTYRELNGRANQLAHYLKESGARPESLVGICVERSLEMIVGLLGILKAGGAYVPLDPSYPKERLEFMLRDTQAPLLLTQEQFSEFFVEYADQRICLDRVWHDLVHESSENPHSQVSADNLAYVIYTSGSTGKPKGAMNTHCGLCNRLQWTQEAYRLTPEDRVLQKTPLSFDVSVWEIFWPLITGAGLVIARPGGHQDSAYLVKLINSQRITTLHFVPSMLRMFLEETGVQSCSTLRQVICSGEALPFELQQRFFERVGAALHNLYGPTEASIDVTAWECKQDSDLTIVPIGRPIANTQIYILDQQLQPVPIGVAGELYIGGEGLARGYLNRPDLTAEKFTANPFGAEAGTRLYKTGDLARYLPDGKIEFIGRLDHQVKIRGYRIELGEIEAVLNQHPTVREAAVLVRAKTENSDGGTWDTEGAGNNPKTKIGKLQSDRHLVAFVVPKQHRFPTTVELRSFLKQKLPEYMVPSAFVMLDQLPLTPSGKLDREALPTPDGSIHRSNDLFIAPRDDIEDQLARIWESVLGTQPIGVTDNFFELGGHSLLAVRLFVEIEKTIGRRLPLATIFQTPTIEQLAGILRREEWSESQFAIWSTYPSSVVPFQPNGSKPPLFWFNWGPWDFRLPRYLASDQPVYGLQHQSQDGHRALYTNIEEMAAHYIKEIRTVQAKGPYFLGGLCIGGMVAFEMARQLQKQGEEVALLVLLDPTNPGSGKLSSVHKDVPSLSSHVTWFCNKVYRHLRELAPLEPQEKLSYALVRVQGRIMGLRGKISWIVRRVLCEAFGCPLSPSLRTHYIVSIYGRAARAYVPQLYRGRVILFKTQGRYRNGQSGWESLVAGELEIQELDTDHDNVFKEPYVQIFAEKLKTRLSEAQRNLTAQRISTVYSPLQ